MMYKLMIVDDETAIRKGLVHFIEWKTVECEVLYEAVNGQDAIEKMGITIPDIIICDIKMPGMNGLELAKYIYENHPAVKVIILTGYADFSYAQTALKYQVIDFVLKPTETEQLFEAVRKAKQAIIQQRQNEFKLSALEGKINQDLSDLQEKFFHDIIDGVVSNPSVIGEKALEFGISLQNYFVIIYDIGNVKNVAAEIGKNDDSYFISNIKNFLSASFKDYRHVTVSVKKRRLFSIISFQGTVTDGMQILINTCEELLHIAKGFQSFSLSIGISNMHGSLVELGTAYREAIKALTAKFYHGDESSISIYSSFINSLAGTENNIAGSYVKEIMHLVQECDINHSIMLVDELLETSRMEKQSIEGIKNTAIHLCASLETLLSNYNLRISDCIPYGNKIYQDILESQTIQQLFRILVDVVSSVSIQLSTLNNRSNYIIRKVMAYINENYKNDINLQLLADHVHMNSSYLSRLFKKETGETITDAIVKVRIGQAKSLLLNSDLRTYEVASAVGIEDPAYFSFIFKKHTGKSPKDYKYLR